MGGSFDPFHYGHLAILHAIKKLSSIQEIQLMPTYLSPFKAHAQPVANHHRLSMLNLVVDNESYCTINTMEIDKFEVSFTYETVKALQILLPQDQFFWVIGSDNFWQLHLWKRINTLLKSIYFIVINRKEEATKNYLDYLNEYFPYMDANRFIFITQSVVSISSSSIREKVTNRGDISSLVPPYILNYIQTHHLYLER